MVVNHKKVSKIMKNMGIACRKRKRFIATTNSNHSLKTYPNLAKYTIVDRIDRLWCADIIYIRILTAFIYLAAIIDAFSHKIVGYAIGKTLALELATQAWQSIQEILMILYTTQIRESSTAVIIT